jgi:hypothetical protein
MNVKVTASLLPALLLTFCIPIADAASATTVFSEIKSEALVEKNHSKHHKKSIKKLRKDSGMNPEITF